MGYHLHVTPRRLSEVAFLDITLWLLLETLGHEQIHENVHFYLSTKLTISKCAEHGITYKRIQVCPLHTSCLSVFLNSDDNKSHI